jgi:hypothetical protein
MAVYAASLREFSETSMPSWNPPMLGFDAASIARIEWRDGSVVCGGGILGRAFDPEALAREAADRAHEDFLRAQPNVVILKDYAQ